MKMIIIGNVRHDNVNLVKYQAYDLPEKAALALIKSKDATTEGVDEQTQTRTFTPKKNRVDKTTGMRVPGEFEDDIKANEPSDTGGVKGVEPASQTDIKGGEKTD